MGKYAAYKVNLGNLAEGHYEKDLDIDTTFFRNMENESVIDADVKVHLDLEFRNGIYDCSFTLKGMMHIPCDRCLDPMEHPVDTTYHIAVKYGPEYDDSSDDVLVIPDTDMSLNVAYMLYDTLVLTIPMRHVHPAGKCNKAMSEVLSRHSTEAEDTIEEAQELAQRDMQEENEKEESEI